VEKQDTKNIYQRYRPFLSFWPLAPLIIILALNPDYFYYLLVVPIGPTWCGIGWYLSEKIPVNNKKKKDAIFFNKLGLGVWLTLNLFAFVMSDVVHI
jgi:hypothetical protein